MNSNINLQDYYSKISEMRSKILSKHQNNTTAAPKVAEITFCENINTYVSTAKAQKNNPGTVGTPLGEVNDQRRTVNYRVRELDDINDKIKSMLAYKRSAQKNSYQYIEKPSSIQKYDQNIESRIKIPQNTNQYTLKNQGISYKKDLATIQRQLSKERTIINQIQKQSYSIVDKIPSKLTESVAQKTFRGNNHTPSKQSPKKTAQKQKTFNQISTQKAYEQVPQVSLKSGQRQKIVKVLLKQVQLDRKLSESKQIFEYYNNPQKSKTLYSAFQRLKTKITGNQIQNWIRFHPQQSNPFIPINSCQQFDTHQFANRVIQAKQHWQKVVKQSISIKNLENESFTITQLDLQAKGYITIEDIVCYLNINSNQPSLRKRDIFSLFKRLRNEYGSTITQNKLKYETFLNFIAK